MNNGLLPALTALPARLVAPGEAPALNVIPHRRKVTIMHHQNQTNTVSPDFAKTSRKYPPFSIQPGELAPGVKTIGENAL